MQLPPVPIERDGISVLLTTEAYITDDGEKVTGICELSGSIRLRPKAWLKAVRDEVARLESIARNAGSTEMRVGGIGGRSWARVLPDYEPHEGRTDIVKKRL